MISDDRRPSVRAVDQVNPGDHHAARLTDGVLCDRLQVGQAFGQDSPSLLYLRQRRRMQRHDIANRCRRECGLCLRKVAAQLPDLRIENAIIDAPADQVLRLAADLGLRPRARPLGIGMGLGCIAADYLLRCDRDVAVAAGSGRHPRRRALSDPVGGFGICATALFVTPAALHADGCLAVVVDSQGTAAAKRGGAAGQTANDYGACRFA